MGKIPTVKRFAGVWACFVLVLLGTTLIAFAAQASKSEEEFILAATTGNQYEISASRLALQNSQNSDVRTFAQHMIDDHTQIGNDMKTVLSSSNAQLKQPDVSIGPKQQKMLDKLTSLKGDAFDKEYLKQQVTAHDETVSLFYDYTKNGDNTALKNFAQKELPTIQEHQQNVKKLASSF
jgi:putative membrane protein